MSPRRIISGLCHAMPAARTQVHMLGMGKLTISSKFILAFASSHFNCIIISVIVLQSWDLCMMGGIKCNEYLPVSSSQSERFFSHDWRRFGSVMIHGFFPKSHPTLW